MEFAIQHRAFIVSLALHFFLLSFFLFHRKSLNKKTVTYIEFIEPSSNTNTRSKSYSKGRGHGAKKINLGSVANKNIINPFSNKEHSSRAWNGFGRNSEAFAVAEKMNIEAEAKNYSDVEMVWQRINDKISYPLDLARERVQGSVDIEFSLNESGKIKKIYSVSGEQPLLNTFVASSFLEIFSNDLPRKLKELRVFSCRIYFKIILSETDREKNEMTHFKNLLTVERYVHLDPEAIEKIQYYTDRMPIKPTPMGPIVDFVALYQLYTDQATTDPLWLRRERILQAVEIWNSNIENFQKSQEPNPPTPF